MDLDEIARDFRTPPATIQEMRWAARCMRDLVSAYRCLSEARPITDFKWENPFISYTVEQPRDKSFWTPYEVEEFVADTLQIGLRGFSPQIAYKAGYAAAGAPGLG